MSADQGLDWMRTGNGLTFCETSWVALRSDFLVDFPQGEQYALLDSSRHALKRLQIYPFRKYYCSVVFSQVNQNQFLVASKATPVEPELNDV